MPIRRMRASDDGNLRAPAALSVDGTAAPAVRSPNVLADSIFSVRTPPADIRLSLPSLLARLLATDDVLDFPRVTAPQRQYWWRFLVRCAGKALHDLRCVSLEALPAELESHLREILTETTGGEDPWGLVYEEGPAFLQPPAPGGPKAAGYKLEDVSRLTAVPGSKNHEFKRGVARDLDAEELVYALLEYQLGSIYTKGNYQSQIMGSASGKGSGVPFMAAVWRSMGRTFRFDIELALRTWDAVRDSESLRGDAWALWTMEWPSSRDGQPASGLSPCFIPLARCVRVGPPDADGRFQRLWFKSTQGPRVADHTRGGGLGDQFVPRVPNPQGGGLKVRGAMSDGFTYRETVRLLFGGRPGEGGQPSASVRTACELHDPEVPLVVFEGLAFDTGKTLGFHRRVVPLPAAAAAFVLDPTPLTEVHAAMLEDAGIVERALSAASRVLMRGDSKPRRGDRALIAKAYESFRGWLDGIYLDELLGAADRRVRGEEALEPWRVLLLRRAGRDFRQLETRLPVPTAQHLRRLTHAEALFRGVLGRRFPDLSSLRVSRTRDAA